VEHGLNGYGTDSSDHLQRAVKLFLKGGVDDLLYAGLEIRLGTEARHRQYAAAWEHIPKKHQNSYKTTEVGKVLERAFRTGNQIARLIHIFADGTPSITLLYTPVSRELREVCNDLGNYLHAVKWVDGERDEEKWIAQLRKLVITGIIHLHIATTGQLLGPALMKDSAGKRQVSVHVQLSRDDPAYAALKQVGANLVLRVDYLPIEDFIAPLRGAFDDIEVLRQLTGEFAPIEIREDITLPAKT
jgi:hypothetical protein